VEDGTATLGYLAKSAGDGGGHILFEITIEGYLATGWTPEVELQQLVAWANFGTEHVTVF